MNDQIAAFSKLSTDFRQSVCGAHKITYERKSDGGKIRVDAFHSGLTKRRQQVSNIFINPLESIVRIPKTNLSFEPEIGDRIQIADNAPWLPVSAVADNPINLTEWKLTVDTAT